MPTCNVEIRTRSINFNRALLLVTNNFSWRYNALSLSFEDFDHVLRK